MRRNILSPVYAMSYSTADIKFLVPQNLGYLPLREDHTLRTGEKLDLLLIRLLRRYEERKGSTDMGENMQWMQENLQSLDRLLDEHGAHRQWFMLFKALET